MTQTEHVELVLDFDGMHLRHIVAYGYEVWGDDHQCFMVDSTDVGPFDTDQELGIWLAKVLRLAHKATLR